MGSFRCSFLASGIIGGISAYRSVWPWRAPQASRLAPHSREIRGMSAKNVR
jgi:hypothetical protein